MSADYQSWVEQKIQEAQRRGEFDNLPGMGKPLRSDKAPSQNWWVEGLIEREHLDMTAALPPQLALRKEGQELPQRIMEEHTETAVRDLLEDFNARVRECWRRPMDGPLAVVRTVDVEALVAQWRRQRASRRPAPAAPVPKQTKDDDAGSWLTRAFGRLRETRRTD